MFRRAAIPRDLEDLTPTWLSTTLGLGTITAVTHEGAAGGIAVTSTVSRLRLALADGTEQTVIAKVSNPRWTHGPHLYEREVRFYRELAPWGLAVPRCLHADFDPATGDHVLLLEDLTDAVPGHRLDGLDHDEAVRVFGALGRLHGRCWEHPELQGWPGRALDGPGLARKFAEMWPRLLAMGRFEVSDALHAAVSEMQPRLIEDATTLARGPRTLIHSDLHAENLLLDDDRVVFLDWQNASFASPALDLGPVLCAVHPDAMAGHGAFLDAWLDEVEAAGIHPDRSEIAAGMLAAMRRYFAGVAAWIVVFEADDLRDVATVHGHWTRLVAAALVAHAGPQPSS